MTAAWLALGSNLGDSRALLERAVALLCDGATVRLVARSSHYRTPPWGNTDQPSFVNMCIAVETDLDPHQLLARAQDVEQALGRDRRSERRWGPRTIDIDILAYEGATLAEDDLKLPHPRLFERPFVLVPLAEIAPRMEIAGRRIADALTSVDRSGIEKLPARRPQPS